MAVRTVTWGGFTDAAPELAAFGAGLLLAPPAYLATLRRNGSPRVHPVTPILTGGGLFVFMEPTSPKGRDLRERGRFALHNGVRTPRARAASSRSAVGHPDRRSHPPGDRRGGGELRPADRYVLFELRVAEARCNGYGDVPLPAQRRWSTEP
jgi:hypothetical protein